MGASSISRWASSLSEDFRFEAPDRCAGFPRIDRQAGLAARLRQKRRRVPFPLGGDLRQQQATASFARDEQAMAADFDVAWPGDGLERAEQRQLDVDVRKFAPAARHEPRIRAAGRHRALGDDAYERLVGFDVSDTAAKFAAMVDGDERAAEART